MSKVSGPILDRFDIIVKLSYQKLSMTDSKQTSSELIKNTVTKSRTIQKKRLKKYNLQTNNEMSAKIIKTEYSNNQNVHDFIEKLNEKNFTSRSIFKIIRLAQTIADIDNNGNIEKSQLLEAHQYKNFIKKN